MTENRSTEFYFQRGDVTLRVEDTLFKLHKDILERHSGFFRDVFSAPPSNVPEGTDKNPLHLSRELCSLDAFTNLCRLMYPSAMIYPPVISLALLPTWEPVLNATTSLQMNGTRAFILNVLARAHNPVYSPSILALCSRNEDVPTSIKCRAFHTLTYRRRPISLEESVVMGIQAAHQVGYLRERIRTIIGSETGFPIYISKFCSSEIRCRTIFVHLLHQNLRADTSDINGWGEIFYFHDPYAQGMCPACSLNLPEQVELIKSNFFDKIVHNYIFPSPENGNGPSHPIPDAGPMDSEQQ